MYVSVIYAYTDFFVTHLEICHASISTQVSKLLITPIHVDIME